MNFNVLRFILYFVDISVRQNELASCCSLDVSTLSTCQKFEQIRINMYNQELTWNFTILFVHISRYPEKHFKIQIYLHYCVHLILSTFYKLRSIYPKIGENFFALARDVSRSTIFVSDSCTVSLSPSTPPPSTVHGPFTLQPRVTLLHANFIADDAESPESLSWILIISGVALARLSTGVE